MIQVDIRPVWRFRAGTERDFDFTLIALLAAVQETGKLTRAAERAGISYRHAWNLIEQWQAFFGAPLVDMARGRGTTLTALGSNLLWAGLRARDRLAPELEGLASEFAAALNEALAGAAPPLVLHASHDFAVAMLHELLAPAGVNLEVRYRGSFEALAALRRGECDVAGFHLPEGRLGAAMARRYAECLPADGFRLLAAVTRTQGLIVRAGNPRGIRGVADLARPGVSMVNRQRGSGTRALLEQMLAAEAIDRARLAGYDIEETTHAAVAALVAGGQADAGFGVQAAAAMYRLGFVPLCRERYWLAVRAEAAGAPAIAALAGTLASPRFAAAVAGLAGYEAPGAGRWAEPGTALADSPSAADRV